MRNTILLTLSLATATLTPAASADIIAAYDFGTPSASTLGATTIDDDATATSFTGSPTVNGQATSVVGTSQNQGYPDEPFFIISRASTTEGSDPANVYFEFTVAADAGFELDLTSLDFDAARGGGATPRTYDIFTSVDGFATSVTGGPVELVTARPNFTPISIDLTDAAYQDLSTITFRVNIFAPNPGQNIDFDNVVVNGTVAAVPEPAAMSAVGAGLMLVGLRRRAH